MSLHEEKIKSEALASRKKIRDLRNEIIRLQSELKKTKASLHRERSMPPAEKVIRKTIRDQRLIDELTDTKRQLEFYKKIALARKPDLIQTDKGGSCE